MRSTAKEGMVMTKGKSISLGGDSSPCQGCTERVSGCHTVCTRYEEYSRLRTQQRVQHEQEMERGYIASRLTPARARWIKRAQGEKR